jgi:hypothetical protein
MISILIALIVGAWAGIGFEAYVIDAKYDETSPFSYYATLPWQTVLNVWELISR